MKRNVMTFYLMLLVMTAFVLVGCRESQQADDADDTGISIDVTFDPNPPTTGDATLLITLTNANGDPVNDATVAVRGDMNHAGMVPVNAEAGNASDGVYSIPFEWTMGGDWILTVTATLADDTVITEEVDVNGVTAVDGAMDMSDMDMTEEAEMDMTPEATEEAGSDG